MVYLQLFLLYTSLASSLAHQKPFVEHSDHGPLTPGFDALAEKLLELYQVPGLSIAVVDKGKVTSKGYGISNFPDTKATADTLYFTGSTTKAFTAAAAGLLVQDEDNYQNLTWSSHLHDFLPDDFILSSSYETEHTTLEDALSHRSGLPRHDLSYGWRHATIKDTMQSLKYLPLTAEPRTRFQYCNLMFGAVGYLVEQLTGSTLTDFLTEKFYKPLNMLSTFFTLEDVREFLYKSPGRHLARGYFWHPDGFYIAEPYIDISPIAGAGSTVSTVNDYAKWVNAWLSAAASLKDGRTVKSPITPRLLSALQKPRSFFDDMIPPEVDPLGFLSPITYALGWMAIESRAAGIPGSSQRISFHGGGLVGFGTELYMLLDDNFGVVTMGNTAGTSNSIGSALFFVLLKQRYGYDIANQDINELLQEAEEWLSKTQHIRETSGVNPKVSTNQQRSWNAAQQSQTYSNQCSNNHQSKPGPVSGVYSHPAYGNVIVTAETREELTLRVMPSARTWPWDVILERNETDPNGCSSNFFDATVRWGAGLLRQDPIPGFNYSCDGTLCRLGDYWTEMDRDALAYFEPRGKGDKDVDRLGLELDEEMMLVARADRSKDGWRKGMIWFERIA